MQFSDRENIKKQVMQEVYAVDPLSDKAFKKFLESDKWFKIIAELVLNRPIPDGCIISIQGEFALTVNGKLIRMDNLRKGLRQTQINSHSKDICFIGRWLMCSH